MMNTNNRVKLCVNPNCWEVNPSNVAECMACGTSLINVKAILKEKIDDEILKKKEKTEVISVDNEDAMVRICDCGHSNAANLRVCEKCGEVISDITPIPQSLVSKTFIFQTLDEAFSYKFRPDISIVGREHQMQEYLLDKSFVGRKHAEIRVVVNGLLIKALKSTNGTYVNNEKLNENEWYALNDGDEVAFGGKVIGGKRQNEAAYFKVRIS